MAAVDGPDPETFRPLLLGLLGRQPEPAPLDPQVIERIELGDGLVREKVTYQVEPGERVPAYLFLPAGAGPANPRPGILAHHQHAGQFHLGKSEPAGLAGNPDQAYALELGRRGYVVLAPDALCFEERGPYHGRLESPADQTAGRDGERFEYTKRVLYGSCLQTKLLWDMRRGVDYLVSRPEVDARRLGAIGHSMGGQQTLFLAALDQRIGAAVSSCGFASLASVLRERINHNFGAYVTGLLRHGDYGDILALVAPRAFLALNGTSDRIFPTDGVQATFARARPAYERLGAADRLQLQLWEGGHQFSPAMREQASAWLDRWLGQGEERSAPE